MIREHDRVVLKSDVASDGLEAGDVGTIGHVYRGGESYEVEFITLSGATIAVVTLSAGQVRPVAKHDVTHSRDLAAVPRWGLSLTPIPCPP
jgi:hypothetical protein